MLRPLLYTGDGLLINVAYRGTPVSPSAQENLGAAITLAATRRPGPGLGPLGLRLRHLLPGLGPSAPVAARRPPRVSVEFDSGPLAGPLHAQSPLNPAGKGR